jgi:hypothetical protein
MPVMPIGYLVNKPIIQLAWQHQKWHVVGDDWSRQTGSLTRNKTMGKA